MQFRDGHAGPGEKSRVNRAERDFPSGLFRDGVGDGVAIAIDIQEIRHGQHDKEQDNKKPQENFRPKREPAGFCYLGKKG